MLMGTLVDLLFYLPFIISAWEFSTSLVEVSADLCDWESWNLQFSAPIEIEREEIWSLLVTESLEKIS